MKLDKLKISKKNKELIKQNDQLLMKIKEINQQISKYEDERSLHLTKIFSLKEDFQKVNNELEDSKKIISQLKLEKVQMEQHQKMDVKQLNTSLNADIAVLKSELEQLRQIVLFVNKPNKINRVDDISTCCKAKCINSNLYGNCINGNGYVRVYDQLIQYFDYSGWKEKEKNNWIFLYAQHPFTKANSFNKINTLYYFEVTMLNKTYDYDDSYAAIGFDKTDAKIFLSDFTHYWGDYQRFDWVDRDVFGCGIVFPPNKDLITKPYVFFTKNGQKIGKEIKIEDPNINFYPFVGVLCCYAETNFGNDLELKPFSYNVYNNL